MHIMEPEAQVRVIDGQLVLIDPTAEGVIAAVNSHNRKIAKENCRITYQGQIDRVQHFVSRIQQLNQSPDDVVIVLINVDDINGKHLADILMPGTDWQSIRNLGQVPYARGLARRDGIQEVLEYIDPEAGYTLKSMQGIPVVIVDHSIAEVYNAEEQS